MKGLICWVIGCTLPNKWGFCERCHEPASTYVNPERQILDKNWTDVYPKVRINE